MRMTPEFPRCLSKWRYLLSGVVVAAAILSAGEAHPEPGRIVARLGPGTAPQWSPNGSWVSFIHEGYLQLTAANGEGERVKLTPYSGFEYIWASDSEIVFAEKAHPRSDTTHFRSLRFLIDSSGSKDGNFITVIRPLQIVETAVGGRQGRHRHGGPMRLPDGSVGYLSMAGSISHSPRQLKLIGQDVSKASMSIRFLPIIIVEQEQSYSVFGDLWLGRMGDTSVPLRRLTSGQRYGLVRMSPQYDRFIAVQRPGSNYAVIDTAGNVVAARLEPVTDGPVPGTSESASRVRWSPDGENLAFVRSVDDGHNVLADRLLITDAHNQMRRELFSTDRGLLGTPAWSPDSRAIAIDSEHDGILILETGL